MGKKGGGGYNERCGEKLFIHQLSTQYYHYLYRVFSQRTIGRARTLETIKKKNERGGGIRGQDGEDTRENGQQKK